jgi:3-isopropylmalate dehydrogenase
MPDNLEDYPLKYFSVLEQYPVGLDLYANVRSVHSRPFLNRGAKNMDLVIMREAAEGFYPGRNMDAGGPSEFMPAPDMALSIRKISAFASSRIARRAFELAAQLKLSGSGDAVRLPGCRPLAAGNSVRAGPQAILPL